MSSYIENVATGNVWTHTKVLRQDIPNSHTDFTAAAVSQDFVLFGIPANHMVMAVKIAVLVDFDGGTGHTVFMHVGNSNLFPTVPSLISDSFVTNVHNCYGTGNLSIPTGNDSTYEYGSFRWFSLSSPGSDAAVSAAYCRPQRFDAHDIIARVGVGGNSGARINLITQGVVEVTVQYTAI